jgi:exopolysaccharide biosynthesis polyprenyl glycosylphosphotransferase
MAQLLREHLLRRYRGLTLALLLDVALINLAFALSYYVRYELELPSGVPAESRAPYGVYLPLQAGYTLLMVLFLAVDGAYTPRRGGNWLNEAYRVFNASTTVGVIVFAAVFFTLPEFYSRALIILAVAFTFGALSLARLLLRLVQMRLRRRGLGVAQVLIVGAGELGRTVMRTIVAQPELGYSIVGFVDDDPHKTEVGRYKTLGSLDHVEKVLRQERVDEVIITLPWMYQRKIVGLVRACEASGVRARVVPDLFQLSINRLDVDDIGGIPILGIKEAQIPRVGRLVKRALDVSLSALALTLASPVMLLAALAIRLESPGPILFRQKRIGEHGGTFTIFKFRSMREGAEEEQEQLRSLNESSGPLFKMRNDPRLTRLGNLLRRTSVDELPQFINVVRGEMSIVGPRPGLPQEVAQYQPWHRQRLEVPPGITGLWQVSGRSDLTFDEMCLLDIYYIENWSLAFDLLIMLRTIPRVLFARGAY